MSRHLPVLFCLLAGLSLSACATAIRGPNVDFVVATEPPGAVVTTDLLTRESRLERRRLEDEALGRRRVQGRNMNAPDLPVSQEAVDLSAVFEPDYLGCRPTPCQIEVSRRAEFTVTVTMAGYHPAVIEITSGFGRGGSSTAAAGSAVSASGAYLVAYSSVTMVEAIVGAFFGGATVSSSAASTATVAAASAGALFLLVDVASGAMLDVRPNPLVLVLVPEDQPVPEGPDMVIDTEEELNAVLGRETNVEE